MGLFGWQGIIPCKAGKMAGICAKLMTEKLINVTEVHPTCDHPCLFSILAHSWTPTKGEGGMLSVDSWNRCLVGWTRRRWRIS
jgi:hypothetical protein